MVFKVKGSQIFFNNKPFIAIGVNYIPKKQGLYFWENWSREDVEEEIRQLSEIGVNIIRVFLITEHFADETGNVNEDKLKKLGELIAICKRYDVFIEPSLLVGPCQGGFFKIPFGKRNLYSDPEAIEATKRYIETIVSRYKDEPNIFAWLISNEITVVAGTAPHNIVKSWLEEIVRTIRNVDPNHLVSSGEGHFEDGFVQENIVDHVDFFGPHIYLMGLPPYGVEFDEIRTTHHYGFNIKRCLSLGKPTILEEFGISSTEVSEDSQAALYKIVLSSTLANGAFGAISWVYADVENSKLESVKPYVFHPRTLSYGIVRNDGTVKPSGYAMKEFINTIKRVDWKSLKPIPEDVNVLIPSIIYDPSLERYSYFQDNVERNMILTEAFTLAKMAHLCVSVIDDSDSWTGTKLLIVPSTTHLLATIWRKLERFAKDGGTVYYSYHINVRSPVFADLFGIKLKLRCSFPEIPEREIATIKFIEDFGSLKRGDKISIQLPDHTPTSAMVPVEPDGSKVVAVDDDGLPAIVVNRVKKGLSVFSTYPLEYYATKTYDVHRKTRLHKLYEALGIIADSKRLATCDNPFAEVIIYKNMEDTEHTLFVINHSYDAIKDNLVLEFKVKEAIDLEKMEHMNIKLNDEETVIPFELGPACYKLLRLS